MHVKSHTHHAVLSLLAMTVVQGVGVWADGDFPASRDPLQWPYASGSIWNTPIGSNAEYVPQPIDPDHTRGIHVDAVVTVMRPQAELMDVYGTQYAWQDGANPTTRCEKWSNTVHLRLPIPTSYVTVFSSSRANNPGAVLLPDGKTLKHPYCFQVCAGGYAMDGLRRPGGEIIDELYNAPESDIYETAWSARAAVRVLTASAARSGLVSFRRGRLPYVTRSKPASPASTISTMMKTPERGTAGPPGKTIRGRPHGTTARNLKPKSGVFVHSHPLSISPRWGFKPNPAAR